MKLIRNHAKKTAVLLSMCILFISCSSDNSYPTDSSTNPTASGKNNNFSGEELFKGIYFSDGEVGSKLANYEHYKKILSQLSPAEIEAFGDFKQNVVAYISKEEPNFFNKFKNVIDSGNRVAIRKGLQDSNKIFTDAVEKITSLNYDQMTKKINSARLKKEIDLDDIQSIKKAVNPLISGLTQKSSQTQDATTIVWVVVAAVAAVVAIEVAAWVDIAYWVNPEMSSASNASSMENELFINSIADLNEV